MGFTITKTYISKGASLARGTTIDAYLSEEDNAALYAVWKKSWPEPLEFSGAIKAITCEMVLEVPEAELDAALAEYKLGKSKLGLEKGVDAAARIREISQRNAGR